MIFNISKINDKFYRDVFDKSMKELNEFFGINWVFNTPNLCILNSREELTAFNYGAKDKGWVVGFTSGNNAFVLDNDKMETESSHKKHSQEEYSALIKHEICHLFYSVVTKGCPFPIWLWEGVSIYLSGQNAIKKSVLIFSKFLDSFNKHADGVYAESGFVVEILVKQFGKEKLLKLISEANTAKTESNFGRLFEKIYGIKLTYEWINSLKSKL